MFVGISPELTQMADRIGDSVGNNIVPLNAYTAITITFIQRYVPAASMGTIFSLLVPHSIASAICGTILLVAWMLLGVPLGPQGPLAYTPVL